MDPSLISPLMPYFIPVYLEVSGALDREDQEDEAALLEGAVELELVAGCGGPDAPLLRELNVAQVAALHDEVTH